MVNLVQTYGRVQLLNGPLDGESFPLANVANANGQFPPSIVVNYQHGTARYDLLGVKPQSQIGVYVYIPKQR